jgi:MscS family membrane protein
MNFSELIEIINDLSFEETWIIEVFVVVMLTGFLNWIQKRLHHRIISKLEQTKTFWDDILFDAAKKPLSVLIWITGLAFAADIVKGHTESVIFGAISPLYHTGVLIVICWFLVRFITRAERNIIIAKRVSGEEIDQTTVDAIAKLLRISVIITGVLVALQSLGYSISGVLAFGGVGGIAVGFAARDLLANFFGGLMIYMDRPFNVGEWIRSPDKEIEGTVEKIGWRLTTIRTFDKRPLYVPNSIFNNISVENPSRMSNRRIKETIGIRYDDLSKMEKIINDVRKMLKEHADIDTTKTLIVNFNEFAPSSLDFFIYTFTKTTDWIRYHEIKQDILLNIINIVELNGAECAFPTSTLHISKEIDASNAKVPK